VLDPLSERLPDFALLAEALSRAHITHRMKSERRAKGRVDLPDREIVVRPQCAAATELTRYTMKFNE
jgi:hypothetical protein